MATMPGLLPAIPYHVVSNPKCSATSHEWTSPSSNASASPTQSAGEILRLTLEAVSHQSTIRINTNGQNDPHNWQKRKTTVLLFFYADTDLKAIVTPRWARPGRSGMRRRQLSPERGGGTALHQAR